MRETIYWIKKGTKGWSETKQKPWVAERDHRVSKDYTSAKPGFVHCVLYTAGELVTIETGKGNIQPV